MKTVLKSTFIILALFITSSMIGQESFYESLNNHGDDATYQAYYNIYKDDKGTQILRTANGGDRFLDIHSVEGIPAGVTVWKKSLEAGKEDGIVSNQNALKINKVENLGYPNTSILLHTRKNAGWVVVGDYIAYITGVSADYTDFEEIQKFLIRNGSAAEGKTEGKKKKKGKFWNKLKDAALNQQGPADIGSGPEYDKAMELDLEAHIKTYLKAMKAKQDGYTLTAKDKADITLIKKTRDDYNNYANNKNDAYWKSAEGQAILANRDRGNRAAATNNVTLKNNSNTTIYVGSNGSRNPGTKISAGGTASWSCGQDAFIQTISSSGGSSNYQSTTQKVYSAGSGCGTTVSIN